MEQHSKNKRARIPAHIGILLSMASAILALLSNQEASTATLVTVAALILVISLAVQKNEALLLRCIASIPALTLFAGALIIATSRQPILGICLVFSAIEINLVLYLIEPWNRFSSKMKVLAILLLVMGASLIAATFVEEQWPSPSAFLICAFLSVPMHGRNVLEMMVPSL